MHVKTFIHVEVNGMSGLNSAPNSPEIHRVVHYMVHPRLHASDNLDFWRKLWYNPNVQVSNLQLRQNVSTPN